MTNELEKQFFDTFGIEPKSLFICKRGYYPEVCTQPTCKSCNEAIEHGKYPQITDHILLELICILTKHYDYADQNWLTKCNDVKELKVSVLRLLLLCSTSTIEKYKHQVRTLFEEG